MENTVRPFIQQDGGDLEFKSFNSDTGVVFIMCYLIYLDSICKT